MGDFLGFKEKASWNLFIGTGIHVFEHFFLKIVQFNKFITLKMYLSCSLKILYLVS